MDKKNILTYEGLKKLEDELENLKVVRRKEVKTATGVPLLCMTNLVWHVMKQWRPSWNTYPYNLRNNLT